jgi:hypothetical protein
MQAMNDAKTQGSDPQMHYLVGKSGFTYQCFVAYRPLDQIENLAAYAKAQTRAGFVLEDDAKWFCKQFNDAVAQKVEPFK